MAAPAPAANAAKVLITVIDAQGLNTHRMEKCKDLFAIVGLGGKMLAKTASTWDAEGNPKFTKSSFAINPNGPLDEVTVSLWGNNGEFDVFLGQAQVALLGLAAQRELVAYLALAARPSDKADVQITGAVHVSVKFKYPPTYEAVYRGVQAYERGEFDTAIAAFTDAIAHFPTEYLLYGFRSAARTDALQLASALADANKAIELQPEKAEGYLRLGNVLVAADDFVKAKEAYLTALKLEPNHDLTVEALREMDKKRKIMQLRKVVTEGRQAFEAGAFDRAAKAFSEAIELNAKNVAYVVYRALTYLAAGDSRVMSDVTAITNVDSNYPKDGPILSGYMSKQGKGLATGWKSRFFILKERFLWYYKSHTDFVPVGVILLDRYKIVLDSKSDARFALIFPNRKYQLKCSAKHERDNWVDMLQAIEGQRVTLPYDEKEKLVFLHDSSLVGGTGVKSMPASKSSVRASVALVGGVVRSGFLYKTGRINTAPKLRWFVLRDRTLFFFQKRETGREAAVYGSIPLQGVQLSLGAEPNSFALITPDRVFNLKAETPEETTAWVAALKAEIMGSVTSFGEEDSPATKRKKLLAKEQLSSANMMIGNAGKPPTDESDIDHVESLADMSERPPPPQHASVLVATQIANGAMGAAVPDASSVESDMSPHSSLGLLPMTKASARQHSRGHLHSAESDPDLRAVVQQSSYSAKGTSAYSSERRYFTKLGLDPAAEGDDEYTGARIPTVAIGDLSSSDQEDLLGSDYSGAESEKASLLDDGQRSNRLRKAAAKQRPKAEGGQESQEVEDEEKGCCADCVIL